MLFGDLGDLGGPEHRVGREPDPSTACHALTLVPATQLVTPRDASDARAL